MCPYTNNVAPVPLYPFHCRNGRPDQHGTKEKPQPDQRPGL